MAGALGQFVIKNDQHIGHYFMMAMKADPGAISQIDAATGEKETKASVLTRFIRLAQCFRKQGLKPGDVLALSGRNHLDVHIPNYAAVVNGLPMCGVDSSFKYDELRSLFNIILPKISFCDPETYELQKQVVTDLGLDTTVVKFGKGSDSMTEYLEKYADETPLDQFRPAEFDINKVYMWLVATSGTTGASKVAAMKHQQCLDKLMAMTKFGMVSKSQDNKPVNALNMGPIHWLTGIFNAMGIPLMNQCKVQTSAPLSLDHVIDIINTYRPETTLTSPNLVSALINYKKACDFTCFKTITVTGMKLPIELYMEVKARLGSGGVLLNMYGQTEVLGPLLMSSPIQGSPNSFANVIPGYQIKLIDLQTGVEVTEPMKQGELFVKGPGFTEYYRNQEETAEAITEDGWYKSGDVFYKDEDGNLFYVERLKSLIKYKSYHVVPKELEEVIRKHRGVAQVAVTSIPHSEDGEHPVAVVVKKPDAEVTAREIIDLVADKLSEYKQLQGGVVFIDRLPLTSIGKVAIGKLKELVADSKKEY